MIQPSARGEKGDEAEEVPQEEEREEDRGLDAFDFISIALAIAFNLLARASAQQASFTLMAAPALQKVGASSAFFGFDERDGAGLSVVGRT